MTESISVYYLPVPDLPLNIKAYHMALVYDKGDGTPPSVIEAVPSIKYGQGDVVAQESDAGQSQLE